LVTRDVPLSVPQLADECGLSPRGCRLALASLVEEQVVVELGTARAQLFRADTRHPLLPALAALFGEEQDRWETLLRQVRAVLQGQPLSAAWYYGSVARGDDGPASDFDIAVVVKDTFAVDAVASAIREALCQIEDNHLVRCSVVGVSNLDVLRLVKSDDEWWKGLSRDAKVLAGLRPEQYATSLPCGRVAA
jgi:predicted nucleotidyltransferase